MGTRIFALALLLTCAPLVAGRAWSQQTRRPTLLDVASHLSTDRVKAGERFTVTLDLTPAPGMHVYAPTVADYKPIAFAIRPQPGLVIGPVAYPPAEKYFYAPLKQTVDVYQKPFQVKQELTLDPSPAARTALQRALSLTVQGTLSYQACDDKICFPPRTVPLTWTVAIKES
jgi:hypothetical protein